MKGAQGKSLPLSVLIPRVLIGVAVVLLVYFTQVTYRFKGTYGDTFLAKENLEMIRGPLADKEYYRMGQLDYQGKDPFEDTLPVDSTISLPTGVIEPSDSGVGPEKIESGSKPQQP